MCFFSLFKSTVSNFMPYYFILDVRLHLFSSIPSLVRNVFVFSLFLVLCFSISFAFFCSLQLVRFTVKTYSVHNSIQMIFTNCLNKKNRFQCTFDETKGFIAHMKKKRMIFCTTTVNVIGLITWIDACYFNLTLLVIKCVNFFVRMSVFSLSLSILWFDWKSWFDFFH